jgi:hypothetical protein
VGWAEFEEEGERERAAEKEEKARRGGYLEGREYEGRARTMSFALVRRGNQFQIYTRQFALALYMNQLQIEKYSGTGLGRRVRKSTRARMLIDIIIRRASGEFVLLGATARLCPYRPRPYRYSAPADVNAPDAAAVLALITRTRLDSIRPYRIPLVRFHLCRHLETPLPRLADYHIRLPPPLPPARPPIICQGRSFFFYIDSYIIRRLNASFRGAISQQSVDAWRLRRGIIDTSPFPFLLSIVVSSL